MHAVGPTNDLMKFINVVEDILYLQKSTFLHYRKTQSFYQKLTCYLSRKNWTLRLLKERWGDMILVIFHFGDFAEYARKQRQIHCQNAKLQHSTLEKFISGFLHLKYDGLFYSSNFGRCSLSRNLGIRLLTSSSAPNVCFIAVRHGCTKHPTLTKNNIFSIIWCHLSFKNMEPPFFM